jgi:hypothetical protein
LFSSHDSLDVLSWHIHYVVQLQALRYNLFLYYNGEMKEQDTDMEGMQQRKKKKGEG